MPVSVTLISQFTANLCQTLDHMIAGNEAPQRPEDSETQLARIGHRLARLYQIMQENRRRVDEERQELQTLVSDISHQVKTPVSNLKMATDTLLEKPMTEAERTDFIRGIRSQTDKLDFLFQALVKTSRLETGVIQLDKKPGRLFDTVAQAMSGIVYAAEKKEIAVSVDCPEDLTVSHDSKWTSEALFNLLDNAVKYTPAGGKIAVSVVLWEMYVDSRFPNACVSTKIPTRAHSSSAPPVSSTAVCFVTRNRAMVIPDMERTSPIATRLNSRFTDRF